MPHRFDVLKSTATRHSPLEDVQGMLTGVVMVALSMAILSHLGLVTGGIAGLALIVHYAFGVNIGLAFFILNLPFYWLALRRVGRDFTLKTFASVAALSLLVDAQPFLFQLGEFNKAYGAILGGMLLGFGLLAMFRHRASLGGVGILAFYLQDRFGWRAGLTQLVIDLCIIALAFFVADVVTVLYSMLAVAVLNIFLAINHRKDRYIAA